MMTSTEVTTMTGNELRTKRTTYKISGGLLCARAGIPRSRLNNIEHGYVRPRAEEMERLETTLNELIVAKRRLLDVAGEVGLQI